MKPVPGAKKVGDRHPKGMRNAVTAAVPRLSYAGLRKLHGWRSLVGYSPWGHKASDTTERLHLYFHGLIGRRVVLLVVETLVFSYNGL